MPKKRGVPAVIFVILIILLILVGGYFAFNSLQSGRTNGEDASDDSNPSSGNYTGPGDPPLAEDEQYYPEWVPFAIDNNPGYALAGYLYEGEKVESNSAREAEASGNNEDRITAQIKEKVPHYPLDQIPLLKPDMLVTTDEKTIDEDISFSVMYYTKSTVDEALEYYKQTLGNYERYSEDEFDASTGKSYDLSCTITIDGKYETNAGVMIMEMPESTGYTCAIMASGAIRGIAAKEDVEVGTREDGLPENFPDNIVEAYKLQEIYSAEGDSQGCYIQFDSRATYKGAVDFYRSELSDKTDFSEDDSIDGEVTFYCLAPGWEISVRIMDSDMRAYIEINCYVN